MAAENPLFPLVMALRHRLRNWRNPLNLTDRHLARAARKYGWSIGHSSYGNPKVRFAGTGAKLTIGSYCSISANVMIFLGGNHRTDFVSTYPFDEMAALWPQAEGRVATVHATRGDVAIGSDVWIGAGALILSGVSIGHGAAIGANAVVTRDVPPYGIAAGNPAKLVRLRFDEATVAALLETAWWDLPRDEVAALIPLIQSARVDEAIAAFRAAWRRQPPSR